MKIRIDSLKDGSHRQDWTGQIGGVDLAYPEAAASIQVRAKLHRLRDLITVRAHIRARLDRPCDRCLKPAGLALEAPLYVVIRQRTVGVAPEEGGEGEVLLTVAYDEWEVDLIGHIRDALVLEVPMAVYCDEACKGICPTCGKDLNEGPCSCPVVVDSRWDALRSLKPE